MPPALPVFHSFPSFLLWIHGQAAVHNRQTFGFNGIGAGRTSSIVQRTSIRRLSPHIHISANICSDAGISACDTHVITQANRSRSAGFSVSELLCLGIVGGDGGGYGYGGHHGHGHRGGGQGAGTRKRATGCRSRSCIVSWCVADTITPLPHLVPYPQSVHPSESLNSRVDILCIMPLSLLFYV